MKITDLTVELFRFDKMPTVKYGAHSPDPGANAPCLGLVRIVTDEGVEGTSFLGSFSRTAELDAFSLIRALKPVLVGRDPLDREALYHRMLLRSKMTPLRAIGTVDVALWDLAGKVAGLPLNKLMGSYRDKVPAYASSQLLPDIAAYVAQAKEIQTAGWKAYKIHPWGRWQDDIRICEAVRAAVGDDFILMLDSTWSYNFGEALRVGQAIERLGYYWYEDPLPAEESYNYVKLKQALGIPILATEHAAGGFAGYASWITQKATDMLRGDPAVKGGLTPCFKAAHLAEAFGMTFEIHHGGNSLINAANLHLMCAIRNSEFFEVLLPHEVNKYGVVTDIEVDAEGMIAAPTRPGIGLEIDYDLIKANSIGMVS